MAKVDDNLQANGNSFLSTGSNFHITDERIARLLVVLERLDRSVAGLEEVPQKELSDLISNAILACGFDNPVEANYAIAAVLQAIEGEASRPCS